MLIVGLGNPGSRYAGTRHNIGFEVVAAMARARSWPWTEVCGARVAEPTEVSAPEPTPAAPRLCLAQPQTFMNRSGLSVRCLVERSQIDLARILVVFDDVALPFGTLRLRPGGSAGGHRGLESILAQLQSDRVARLRIGVAPLGEREPERVGLSDFVLAPFAAQEAEVLERVISRAVAAADCWIGEGVEKAMNRFNGALPAEPAPPRPQLPE